MTPPLPILAAALLGSAGHEGELLPSSNYSVILRHGSQANCPCFRIPCLVTTVDAATTATLVLLVEARWSSSECYPISGPKPPRLPPSPPALALVSSTDAVRPFLTIPSCCCLEHTLNPCLDPRVEAEFSSDASQLTQSIQFRIAHSAYIMGRTVGVTMLCGMRRGGVGAT